MGARSCFHMKSQESLMFKHGSSRVKLLHLDCSTTYKLYDLWHHIIFLNLRFLICKSYLSIHISVYHISPKGLFEN